MTRLDDRLRPKILSLIQRVGKTVTYTQLTRVRNDTTGETDETPVNTSVKVTPPARYRQNVVDGNSIRMDDVRASLAAKDLAFTPAPLDTVTIDSVVFAVVTVMPVYSGEREVIWTLQLRRR